MRILCIQALGLFIWAAMAIKFIQEQVNEDEKECLNDVFDKLNVSSMGSINMLYGKILQLTHKREKGNWPFERFCQMVGCIVILKKPLCIADITSLLDLWNPRTNAYVNIECHVR